MHPALPLVLILVAAALYGCATHDRDAATTARVDALLEPLAASGDLSGAVVLMRDGRTVYTRAIGLANREANVAFSADTPSDGASLAKTFTAAAVHLLVAEGRMSLDAPVTRYVAEYPHATTTLRHLLAHSAGLPDYDVFDSAFAAETVRTTKAMLDIVAARDIPPAFTPGTRFEYSSFAFDVAALAVERVTGRPFEAWLRERFFDRLAMTATFVRPARLVDWPGPRTIGYRRQGDAGWQVFDVFDNEGFHGGSNFYLSAHDLARWANAFASGTVLPADVVRTGLQPAALDSGAALGLRRLSWYCDTGAERCSYAGDLHGFYSIAVWDRRRRESAVYVSNSTLPPWRRAALAADLADALAGRPAAQRPEPVLAAYPRTGLAAIAGRYHAATLGAVTIEVRDGLTRLRIGDGPGYRAFRVSRDVFTVPGLDLWLGFAGAPIPHTLYLRSVFVDVAAARMPAPAAG